MIVKAHVAAAPKELDRAHVCIGKLKRYGYEVYDWTCDVGRLFTGKEGMQYSNNPAYSIEMSIRASSLICILWPRTEDYACAYLHGFSMALQKTSVVSGAVHKVYIPPGIPVFEQDEEMCQWALKTLPLFAQGAVT